jgi:hypothetical protein
LDPQLRYLSLIGVYFALFPILVGVSCYKYFQLNLKLIFLLVCVGFTIDLINAYFAYVLALNNLFLFYFFTVFEFFILTIFYKNNSNSLFLKRIHILIFVFFISYVSIVFYHFGVFSEKSMQIIAVESSLVFCFAIFYLYKFLRSNTEINLIKLPFFWIVSSHVIYFSPSILYFLFFEYLSTHLPDFLNLFGNISHLLLTTIYYTLIAIGFIKSKNKNYEIKTN